MAQITVDATNQALGRLASKVATLLRGKHLASYKPQVLPNTEVIVKNIGKVKFTGKKFNQKVYYHYSGYHSGIRAKTLKERWEKSPADVLRYSVYRMLPKNRTRDKIIRNLKVQ